MTPGRGVRPWSWAGPGRLGPTAAEPDTVDGVAYPVRGTPDGPSTAGVTRLSGDAFDDPEGLGPPLGGGGAAHWTVLGFSALPRAL